jgi:hypothetical protein
MCGTVGAGFLKAQAIHVLLGGIYAHWSSRKAVYKVSECIAAALGRFDCCLHMGFMECCSCETYSL